MPSGIDSTMADTTTAAATIASDGAPKNMAMPMAAIPAAITKPRNPPQLLMRFQGSGAIGTARPMTVANPSPNARITHPTAASSMCQLNVRISAQTASG